MRRCWAQSDSTGERNDTNKNPRKNTWQGCVCVRGGSKVKSQWTNHPWSEKVGISDGVVNYQHAHILICMTHDVQCECEEFIVPMGGSSGASSNEGHVDCVMLDTSVETDSLLWLQIYLWSLRHMHTCLDIGQSARVCAETKYRLSLQHQPSQQHR